MSTVSESASKISDIMNRSALPPEPKAPPAQPVPEQPEDPDVEVEEQETPESESDEGEVDLPEANQKPSKEAETEDDTEEEDATEIELEPFQLAKILGLKSEDDIVVTNNGELYFKAKIDGKEREVSFDELRDSYQLSRTHYERLHKLSDEKKAFEDQRRQSLEQMQSQMVQMNAAIQQLENDYSHDFEQIDWKRLREEDPTEYTLRRTDFEEKQKRLGRYKEVLAEQYREIQQNQQAHVRQLQVEGQKKLSEVFDAPQYKHSPKWDQTEQQRLFHWLENQGFTADDINGLTVWQVFKWARDSMLREDELKTATKTLKRIVKLPKVVKPGTPKTKPQVKKSEIEKLRTVQRRSGGSLKSSQDLISKILRG